MLPAVQSQRYTLLFSSCPQHMYCSAGKCRGILASWFKDLQPCRSVALMCFISSLKIISSKVSLSKWEYLFREAKIQHSIRREPGKNTFTLLNPLLKSTRPGFPSTQLQGRTYYLQLRFKDWVLVLTSSCIHFHFLLWIHWCVFSKPEAVIFLLNLIIHKLSSLRNIKFFLLFRYCSDLFTKPFPPLNLEFYVNIYLDNHK